jgi:peptide/nickel transport system substrate-binding protein
MLAKEKRTGASSIGLIIFFMGLLTFSPCLADTPQGKVVIVNSSPFEGKGGDPHTAYAAQASQCQNTVVFDGLTKKMADGRIYPALAKSWEFSKDFLSVKMTLDERPKFHNGEPVTAEDVKFSWERARKPELKFYAGGQIRRIVEKIEVVNDQQLVFHFTEIWAAFADRAAGVSIVPKSYTERVGDEEFAMRPIGAGPFRWIKHQQDVYFDIEAIDDHYRKAPFVKTINYKIVAEHPTRMAMLKTGEADMAFVDWASVGEVQKDPKLRIQWSKYTYVRTIFFYDLAFPDKPSPWHDIRVRKALAYAIDREGICKNVLHGSSEPWGDVLAPYHPGYDPNIKPYPYDPERAKQLLKEAGYPNGFETTLTTNLNTKPETEAVAAILRKVGIIAKLNVPEEGIWARAIMEKKLHGIGSMPGPWWGGFAHPGPSMMQLAEGYAWAFVTTPELGAAVKKLNQLMDEKEIIAEARKISKLYQEQMVRVNLWAKHIPYGLGPRIEYWENVPGWMYPSLFEYLKIKD